PASPGTPGSGRAGRRRYKYEGFLRGRTCKRWGRRSRRWRGRAGLAGTPLCACSGCCRRACQRTWYERRMRALRLRAEEITAAGISGRVLTHDLGPGVRKGTVLSAEHLELLRVASEVHVVELDEGDVHEDEAVRRLGRAIGGPGTRLEGPVQSQVRLKTEVRGLVRGDQETVESLNQLPAVGVFTVVDGQAVEVGEEVAGAKVTP